MKRTGKELRDYPILCEYYENLTKENEEALKEMDIPKSDIFYARAAWESRSGEFLSVVAVREHMENEGLLSDND